jgi:hypothetical protein
MIMPPNLSDRVNCADSLGNWMLRSGPKIGKVDVRAAVNVVKQVPAGVVWVFIDHEVVAAIPAPIRANRPIPIRHLEVEPTREPEAVVIAAQLKPSRKMQANTRSCVSFIRNQAEILSGDFPLYR